MPDLARTLEITHYGLMIAGGVVLTAWAVVWWRRGRRDPLRHSPLRANRLTPVLVWLCFLVHLLGWTLGDVAAGWTAPEGLDKDGLESWHSLLANSTGQIMVALTCLVVGGVAFRAGWRGFGLGRRPIGSEVMWALAGWLAALCACNLVYDATRIVIRLLAPDAMLPQHSVLEVLRGPPVPSLLRVAAICGAFLIAPVSEELFFRGIVQTGIKKLVPRRWGSLRHRWIAIAGASVFFALMHWTTWHHTPALLGLAVILGYVYERRGSLVAPILVHMLFNGRTLLLSELERMYGMMVSPVG